MFSCNNCQTTYSKWQGRCDKCGEWNTLEESTNIQIPNSKRKRSSKLTVQSSKPIKLTDLKDTKLTTNNSQLTTNIGEFDNAIGGRLIPGQVILLAGSPGTGKSTLALKIAEELSIQGKRILYIAGEESPLQIKHRSDRMNLKLSNVMFYQELDISQIESYIATQAKNIDLVFVDSIQTLFSNDLNSTMGSVSQISETANRLIGLAKGFNIVTFIIGHITKTGDIAGPKILEHMVDTVLYFEGDKKYNLRILRVEKNRFGPTDEVGIFKMVNAGLEEIKDTKELFDSKKEALPGSVYSLILEGNRPIVVEVQALATKTYFSIPRRNSAGFELNRLYLLLAIIDKKLKLKTFEYDVYVNITGGITVKDPALDLAVIKAIISSIKNEPVDRMSVYFGEVGLTGEIRKVASQERREKEVKRLGFNKVVTYNTGRLTEI